MEGDFNQRGTRQRAERLITDVTPERGLVARTWHTVRSLVSPAARVADPTAEVALLPATGRRPPWLLISFIAFVVVPGLLGNVYFAFLATDQYVVEARAVVRSTEQEAPVQSAGGSSPGAMTLTTATANAYVVTNYIRSRAMVDDLGKTMNLREIFRRPEADFWARLERDATVEDLVEYWKDVVMTYVDGPSGIVTIRIRAFRRDDAMALMQAVLKLSEKLVNEMSDRARRDAMQFAEQEVRRADGLVRDSLGALRRYRDEEGLIDPIKSADETSKLFMQLMAEKIRLDSDLFVVSRSMKRDAPTVQALAARIQITETQIAALKATLTGEGTEVRNIAAKLARFEELEVQRQFAERLYTMAQDGLERARILAERQSVYLTVFVPPSVPEDSLYPRRVAFSLLLSVAFFIIWSIVALMWASVLDHRV